MAISTEKGKSRGRRGRGGRNGAFPKDLEPFAQPTGAAVTLLGFALAPGERSSHMKCLGKTPICHISHQQPPHHQSPPPTGWSQGSG